MCQVIFRRHGSAPHNHRGAHVKGRNGHDRDAHPLWPRPRYVKPKRFNIFIPHLFEDIDGLLSAQELLLVPTAARNTFHFIRILNFHMQSHLGVFRLVSITVVTLLFRTDKMMHGIQPPLPILNHSRPRKLVLPLFHCNTAAMKTDTAQCLECRVKESVVVYWTGQLDVTEISRIRFVVKITKTGIVDTSVDGLPCYIGLISSHPRRNLPSIHRNRLRHRILLQLFRINHTKL
mmetsp:Transcript_21076/g.34771  ORF Transcript_21076/g.34771 Transcript_21076/m.34771 type:complete len:233 (-) Transcript_21076:473-1171(-)